MLTVSMLPKPPSECSLT